MLRTALVHDWLTGVRGGEKVLELLCGLLPQSDLYTMVHRPGRATTLIENRRITTSCLNRLPRIGRLYPYALPLMPWAAGRLKLRGYDLVIAVSTCVAHGVDVDAGTRFIVYCNTPMRYAWETLGQYAPKTFKERLEHLALRGMSPFLRRWDRRAAGRADGFIANSFNVRDRVKRCYDRDASVIHPPVDTDYFRPDGVAREDFYLWAGALVPYKRIDVALEAFARLDRRLVVIGQGRDLAWARRNAPDNVIFLGRQPDEVLRDHYRRCRALVFPGVEDFGIVPLEAQACGAPVIAFAEGGALETVVGLDGDASSTPTGVFFRRQTGEDLAEAILRFERHARHFDPVAMRRRSLVFSRRNCRRAWEAVLHAKREEPLPCVRPGVLAA